MNCQDCGKPLTSGLDTFGWVNEELCWDCYATRNAEAGEPHYGLGPHVHDFDPETGAMTTTFLPVDDEEFMPDPDAPGLGVWMPKALPGWR